MPPAQVGSDAVFADGLTGEICHASLLALR